MKIRQKKTSIIFKIIALMLVQVLVATPACSTYAGELSSLGVDDNTLSPHVTIHTALFRGVYEAITSSEKIIYPTSKYGPRQWQEALLSHAHDYKQETPLNVLRETHELLAVHGIPDLDQYAITLTQKVLQILPLEKRTVLMERLKMLGKGDVHGLHRWLKDIIWIAAHEWINNNLELISFRELVSQLEATIGVSGERLERVRKDLEGKETEVKKQLAQGKAICCYGFEVRFDPLQQRFDISRRPVFLGYSELPLVVAPPSKVVISVLVYNGWADVQQLLISLLEVKNSNVEVVILDNGSRENRFERLRRFEGRGYKLTLMRSDVNLGFDEGHNVVIDYALDQAHADHVLLLNSDLVVAPEFLDGLLSPLRTEQAVPGEQIGAVGPIVYVLKDGQKTRLINNYGARFPKNSLFKRSRFFNGQNGINGVPEMMPVDYLLGMAMLFPVHALRTIGGFDPRYFAYNEELDVGIRLKNAGFVSIVTRKSAVWHTGGSSSGGSWTPFPMQQSPRNVLLNFSKHSELWQPKAFMRLCLFMLNSMRKSIIYFLKTGNVKSIFAPLKGLWLGITGKFDDTQVAEIEVLPCGLSNIDALQSTSYSQKFQAMHAGRNELSDVGTFFVDLQIRVERLKENTTLVKQAI